jgi:hypothetical protein
MVATRPDGGSFGTPVFFDRAGYEPAVAMNPRGDTAIAFQGDDGDWTRPGLYVALRPAGSSNFVSPIRLADISSADVGIDFRPSIAVAEDGRVIVVWRQVTPTGHVIKTSTLSPDGAPGTVQTVSAPGGDAWHPDVAADVFGRTVVTWIDMTGRDPNQSGGPVYASLMGLAGIFAAPVALGGQASARDGAPVGVDSQGHIVVIWGGRSNSVETGTFEGGFSAPTDLGAATDLAFGGPALGSGGAGSIYVWRPWLGSIDVLDRPTAAAPFGAPRAAYCTTQVPAGSPWIFAAIKRADGDDVLWGDRTGLMLTSRTTPTTGTTVPCGPTTPSYTVSPSNPMPGEDITIDASSAADPRAQSTTWSWDLDGDGKFEVPPGDTKIEHVSYPAAGYYSIQFRAENHTASGAEWTTGVATSIHVRDPATSPTYQIHAAPRIAAAQLLGGPLRAHVRGAPLAVVRVELLGVIGRRFKTLIRKTIDLPRTGRKTVTASLSATTRGWLRHHHPARLQWGVAPRSGRFEHQTVFVLWGRSR